MDPITENSQNQWRAGVVLVEPQIPQNTGSIARTCAALGCSLHLIEPLGFSLEDKYLKRAGLDYWHLLDIYTYPDLDVFYKKHPDGIHWFFSKKAVRSYHEADFKSRDPVFFFFGKETWGLPEQILTQHPEHALRIPMRRNVRSLNLSNSVALVLYEAFRQNGFPGLV